MVDRDMQTSGVPMIRIDGAKVRQLREDRGLTQLYVATAVEVTTDTISRWENRRYPTIKRENGLRLAAALEVELEQILEKPNVTADSTEKSPHLSQATHFGIPLKKYNLLINIGLGVMIPVVISLMIWKKQPGSGEIQIGATRSLPTACAPGLSFPVIITVHTGREMVLLVRENVPAGVEILKTVPDATSQADNTLKWIRKEGRGELLTGYLARATGEYGTPFTFSGSIAVRQGQKQEADISGDDSLRLMPVHWADTNGDFIISDDEILEVYDKFGGLPGLALDLDSIEEIWIGSGYRWNKKGQTIIILP
ncbi:MAG: helix-turn-helix transcriptional regulator [Thermodesulfobacteriota bacterium]|nr:helix-turn-helix transcriptional regulator [Thermodesulfobacteriota bacterium]